YCCSSCRVADPFSSLSTFSSSFFRAPVFHSIDDCEHTLLYLPDNGIAPQKTAISGSSQQNLPGICSSVWSLSLCTLTVVLDMFMILESFAFMSNAALAHEHPFHFTTL
uniref:Uncharacterized protein n=1 Tax=Mus spicilegus TaxID=10103 RepID=A0A8C6IN21_MUSSI